MRDVGWERDASGIRMMDAGGIVDPGCRRGCWILDGAPLAMDRLVERALTRRLHSTWSKWVRRSTGGWTLHKMLHRPVESETTMRWMLDAGQDRGQNESWTGRWRQHNTLGTQEDLLVGLWTGRRTLHRTFKERWQRGCVGFRCQGKLKSLCTHALHLLTRVRQTVKTELIEEVGQGLQ